MTNPSEELSYGTVKAYYAFKGYGFITREKGKDIFFLFRDVREESDIIEGAKVAFRVVEGEKGPRAEAIRRVG
ncbi:MULTISPECIES: retron Se72 family effector protein [unclassified Paraburkholderia]|uniref:retron Se72 family effector protein n=1 Tax=unclassified Paraburkholderia TaxID=2615204 RepID=UPI000D325A60